MITECVKLLALICVSLCCNINAEVKMTEKTPNSIYRPYLNEMTKSFAQEITEQYGLYFSGDGGIMHEKIREISVSFIADRRASLEEARELEVRILQRLLEKINANEKIRSYLCKYPFDIDNIRVSISFQRDGSHFSDGTISFVCFGRENKVYYSCNEIFTNRLEDDKEEPYSEALKIVEEHPLQQDLRYHKAKPYEAEIDQLQYKFAEDMYKKWGFKCADIGGKMVDGIEQVAFNFILFKRATLEEARIWEIKLTEELLRRINSNPKLRPYLKNYPFHAKNTQIKIEFWDKEREYYRDGSIARMYQKDNRIYYLKCAPDLVTPEYTMFETPEPYMDEPYEEALKRQKLN
jgi:hypothetical protein